MYSKCAICRCNLTKDRDSVEHVIPNAIGGRLKVRGFLCIGCNGKTGAKWDAVLTKQLNALCVLLGVEREHGEVPDEPIEQASGRELLLQADGMMKLRHPIVEMPRQPPVRGETLNVKVQARSLKEVNRITKELEAHYAQMGGRLENVTIDDSYTYDIEPTTFEMSVGGEGASLSIVKTALAFAHHCGVRWQDCEQAQKSFAGEIEPCFGYYSQPEDVIVRDRQSPCHYLILRGCPESALLLCYVELFSVYGMIVCLSTDYTGKDITHSYGIDPTTGEVLDVRMDFDFGSISIDKLYGNVLMDTNLLSAAMDRLGPPITKRSLDEAFDRALEQAIEDAAEQTKVEQGDDYTEGTFDPRYANENMLPFFEHAIRLRRSVGN